MLANFHSLFVAKSHSDKSQGFVNNIVGGEEGRLIDELKLFCPAVFTVIFVEQGIPCAGINAIWFLNNYRPFV